MQFDDILCIRCPRLTIKIVEALFLIKSWSHVYALFESVHLLVSY